MRCPKHSHNLRGTLEYNSWHIAKQRCYSPNHPRYVDYGARGIGMCDGWRYDFEKFYRDLGPRPTTTHSIDRRDNGGGYWCGTCKQCLANNWAANCKWATKTEQMLNTRRSRILTLGGRSQCLPLWATELGIKQRTLRKRLDVLGWTEEQALTTGVTR